MLTGSAEIVDRVVGLEIGADDYVAKPVDLREFWPGCKRRPAAHARADHAGEPTRERQGMTCAVRRLPASTSTRTSCSTPDGSEIAITPMEFRLLKVFAEHRGKMLNRDQLLELAHDRGWDPFDRSIDIRVSRLRKKIEPDA